MVGQQIRSWHVLNREVLQAFDSVPRERFVPEAYLDFSFADMPIPIGDQQTMLEPKVIARMIDALALHAHLSVLEIGTGTGYSSAILAVLCRQVVSLEIDLELAAQARKNLDEAKIDNVEIIAVDCFDYCSLQSDHSQKFDRVLVTGSVPELSPLFLPMISEAGRIVGIQGRIPSMQVVACDGSGTITSLFETFAPQLCNVQEPVCFAF